MDIVDRLKEGDDRAFSELLDQHKRMVFYLAYNMVGDFNDAEDIAQEVFLRVFRGIKGFRKEASLKTWIMKITLNLCRRHCYRNRLVRLLRPLGVDRANIYEGRNPYEIPAEGDPSGEAERNERLRLLRSALMRLPIKQRRVFVMKHLEGLKIMEIAEVLGCSEGTVKANLFKAINSIKRICTEMER